MLGSNSPVRWPSKVHSGNGGSFEASEGGAGAVAQCCSVLTGFQQAVSGHDKHYGVGTGKMAMELSIRQRHQIREVDETCGKSKRV